MQRKRGKLIVGTLLVLIIAFMAITPAAYASEQIVAKPGDDNSKVKEIKMMLKDLGYMSYSGSSPSGYYSTVTRYAIYYFQRDNRLPITGITDFSTYGILRQKYSDRFSCSVKPLPVPKPPQPLPELKPIPQPAPEPKPLPVPEPVQGLNRDEELMFNYINQERAKVGVAPLKLDLRLVQTARMKSGDMIKNNYFAHTSPTLGEFHVIIRKTVGNEYGYLGENLAGAPTVSMAHNSLMNSEGHRRNILNPNYTHIGLGVVDGRPYGKMFTQHFGG